VAGHAAAVGDQRGGAAHGRHPVRGGHDRHQDLAVLEPVALAWIGQPADPAGGPARRRGQTGDELGAGGLFLVQGGDRTGLHQPGPAVGDRPLHVLWAAVVLLHPEGEPGQLDRLVVGQHPARAGLGVEVDPQVVAVRAAHDLVRLVAGAGVQQPWAVLGDDVGVGFDRAADDHLAQPVRALDDDAAAVAGGRVGGERHAGPRRVDHLLHHHGDRRLLVQLRAGPVGDHARPEQRGPAVDQPGEHVVDAVGVGVGGVHAGERRAGGVLGGRRRPDRHLGGVAQLVVRGLDLGPDVVGDAGLAHQGLDPLTGGRQLG
jgi:hypothetical protein